MSLWSRSELCILLYPERVALMRTERRLALKGSSSAVRARVSIPCAARAGGGKPWRGALQALETALPGFAGPNMRARVVLSDTFMHYALIPWYDNLSDEEDLALARHRFKEMCGDAADALTVSISPGPAGLASLAGAVEADLIQELTALTERSQIHIRSIQPHLMVACNSASASLAGRNAWIALHEPDSLCLGALRQGHLAWIRKLRIGDTWQDEFSAILERETCLADTDPQMDEVLLWAPHLADEDLPRPGRWRVSRLTPDPVPRGRGDRRPHHSPGRRRDR